MIRNNKYQIKSNEMQAKKQHRNLIKEVVFFEKNDWQFCNQTNQKKEEKTQVSKIRDEKGEIIRVTYEI